MQDWKDLKSAVQYGTRSELESILHTLNEVIFEYEPLYLRSFNIHSIKFYHKADHTKNVIYIAITVSLRDEIYCTLNIYDPLSKQCDMDDLDIFMRRSAPQDVSRRVRTVLKLIEPPDKIEASDIASTVYLSRVIYDFHRLHEQGYLSYFDMSTSNEVD